MSLRGICHINFHRELERNEEINLLRLEPKTAYETRQMFLYLRSMQNWIEQYLPKVTNPKWLFCFLVNSQQAEATDCNHNDSEDADVRLGQRHSSPPGPGSRLPQLGFLGRWALDKSPVVRYIRQILLKAGVDKKVIKPTWLTPIHFCTKINTHQKRCFRMEMIYNSLVVKHIESKPVSAYHVVINSWIGACWKQMTHLSELRQNETKARNQGETDTWKGYFRVSAPIELLLIRIHL